MILDLCPYWVYPITGGGPSRVYNLNKSISNKIPLCQYSFRPTIVMKNMGLDIFHSNKQVLSSNYEENRISFPIILASSYFLYKFSLPQDLFLSPISTVFLKNKLEMAFSKSNIIQVEHPWLFDFALKQKKTDALLVSCSHNFETSFLNDQSGGLNDYISNIERKSIDEADIVFSVSEDDIKKFIKKFDISNKKECFVIPNGVDCDKFKKVSQYERTDAKHKLGFDDKIIILFIGSVHKPNFEAIEIIEDIAKKTDNRKIFFLIVGSVGIGLKSHDNVMYTGFVENTDLYLRAADIAINPLISGSGTSLKMLEYMACGLPVISTPTGARGLNLTHKEECIITDISSFNTWIIELSDNSDACNNISDNARMKIEKIYDWNIIASKVTDIYNEFTRG